MQKLKSIGGRGLIRLEKKSGKEGENILGFDWIEILAVTPSRYRKLTQKQLDARGMNDCESMVVVDSEFICKTEFGIMSIDADEFWEASESYEVAG